MKSYNNFLRVFEKANQLLSSHTLYLLPCMNGNSFSFWNVNKVDLLLLVRCLYNKPNNTQLLWRRYGISLLMFNSISYSFAAQTLGWWCQDRTTANHDERFRNATIIISNHLLESLSLPISVRGICFKLRVSVMTLSSKPDPALWSSTDGLCKWKNPYRGLARIFCAQNFPNFTSSPLKNLRVLIKPSFSSTP